MDSLFALKFESNFFLPIGFWTDKEELKKLRQSEVVFKPQKKWQEYEMSMENWVKAVKRSMNWYNKMQH